MFMYMKSQSLATKINILFSHPVNLKYIFSFMSSLHCDYCIDSETPGELRVILKRFKYTSTSLHFIVFTLQQESTLG